MFSESLCLDPLFLLGVQYVDLLAIFILGVTGREQRWRKKIICCSRQHVWDKSLLQSNSGFRKIRASNSTAGSYGGSAEISKGQPLAWISTWPNKQVSNLQFAAIPNLSLSIISNDPYLFFVSSPLRFSDADDAF